MDKKITNKRANVMDIIHIAEMMERHCKYYHDNEQEENRKKEEARARDEYYSKRYVSGYVKYTIQFNNNETITKENDIGWFNDTLLHNAKIITDVNLYFSGSEDDKKETLQVGFTHNRIDFYTTTSNMYDNPLANMVESYINSLPVRFDEIVDKDTRRKMIPALSISIPFGIIVPFILLILTRSDIISAGVAKFLTSGIVLTAIFFIIAFFGALLIPTKNTDLYRYIKFETYFAGRNDKTYSAIWKNDYAEYKSKCEVAIGQNANMPIVRQKIEENYKKAKKILKVELIISLIAIILFYVL